MVENRALGYREHEAGSDADVMSSRLILRGRGVFGVDHGGGYVGKLRGSAEVHADRLGDALAFDVFSQLIDGHYG